MIMIKIKLNSSSSLSRYTFFLRIPSKYSTKLIYHHQKSDHFVLSSFPVYALMLLLSKHHHNSHTTQLTTRHINQQSYTHKLKLHLAWCLPSTIIISYHITSWSSSYSKICNYYYPLSSIQFFPLNFVCLLGSISSKTCTICVCVYTSFHDSWSFYEWLHLFFICYFWLY